MTATGHGDLPDEQGTANAPAETGSGRKTATGHVESDPGEADSGLKTATGPAETTSESKRDGTNSGQKTAIDHAATTHRQTATETSRVDDALDRLTASGKRSESENDETGHESCPTESGLHDPSLFLGPKTGKHGRIANGSGPPKTLSTHHLAGRAVMSGERQLRKERSGQQGSAASEQLPAPQPPKESRRQKHACAHRTSVQRHFHPSRWRRGSPTGSSTRYIPRLPPLSPPF